MIYLLGGIATILTVGMVLKREPVLGWIAVVFWFLFGGACFVASTSPVDIYRLTGVASMFIGILVGASSFQFYKGTKKDRDNADADFIDEEDSSQYIGETRKEAWQAERGETNNSMSEDMPNDNIDRRTQPSQRTQELRDRARKRKSGIFKQRTRWGEWK